MTLQHHQKIRSLSLAFLLVMLHSSCFKETIDEVLLPSKWSPDIAIPIGTSNLTINNYFYNYPTDEILDSIAVYFDDQQYLIDSNDLSMNGVLPFALQTMAKESDNIRQISFRANVENGYPSQAMIQLYLLDANNTILDSVLYGMDRFLVPGTLTGNREIIPSKSQKNFIFDKARIEKIRTVENIRIVSGISVSKENLDTLMLYPEYKIEAQIGVRIAFDLNPDSAMNTYQEYY